jgi:hypothetical protein
MAHLEQVRGRRKPLVGTAERSAAQRDGRHLGRGAERGGEVGELDGGEGRRGHGGSEVVVVVRKEGIAAAATRWRVSASLAGWSLSGASGRASGVCWKGGSGDDGVSRVLVSLAARTFSFFQLSPLPQQLSCTALSAV